MCSDMTLNVDLKELKEELTTFRYALDDMFFASFPASEIRSGKLSCELAIRSAGTFYEFYFRITGTVTVPCDRCLDDMELPISADNKMIVKLGDEYFEDDDMIIVDSENPVVDVAWLIYEFVTLSLPLKHTHPKEQCNADMLKYITDDDASGSAVGDAEKPADPRWNKLSELLEKN